MYKNKSDFKSEVGGDGLPPGGDPKDESHILNFVDSVETLNVVVERPVAGWQPTNHNDKESFTLPSEGTKGLALIINIVEFDKDITNRSRRFGSEHDVEYLTDLLIQLDYKLYPSDPSIRERKNKSKRVIKRQIESFKNVCTQQRPASIIVFIGSHGRHPNQIKTSDRQWMDIYGDIVYQFTQDKNFTVLLDKPKIFLIQACQSYSPTSGSVATPHLSVHQEQQQKNEDVYICTATTPGKVSKRNIYKGSRFIYCFTYMMMKHALKMKSLQEIMDLVKNRMDEIKDYQEYKQVPSYISGSNEKPLYFVGSDYSIGAVRNYAEKLSWMEAASQFRIICTVDKQITCDKLTDHFRKPSILIHKCKNFSEFLSSDLDETKLDDHVVDVVMDCTIKHIELYLHTLDQIKRHRIIFITTVDKQSILNLNPAEYKVDVIVDPMRFQDLSPAYQFKITETLENKYGISLSGNELQGELLVDVITGREMFHDEIKKRQLPYYVRRMVQTRNIISDELFTKKYPSDIFLVRGIQRIHLSSLVKNQMTGRSQDQLEKLEDNFMTLDNDDHFDIICQNTTKSVHMLNYENGKFRWVQTKGNIRTVQEHVSKQHDEQMEEDFLSLICADSVAPVCISASPGMGKTILLAQIGKRLRRMFPDRTVLFIELTTFIQRIPNTTTLTEEKDQKIIVMALQDIVCKTQLGRHILGSKLKSEQVSIELLLDGFDEVEHKDSDFAHSILKAIRSSFPSIRMWITSRLHKLIELEETLDGLGYNIKPFQLMDQVNFLTQFWSKNPQLNSQRLREFAHHCLKSLKGKINSSQQDIAGIPLQCLLIGEVYERRAVEYANNKIDESSPLPEQFIISSITTLYQELVKKKFEKYESTYGAQGSQKEDVSRRSLIMDWFRRSLGWKGDAPSTVGQKLSQEKLNKLHGYLGLHHLFPDLFKKLKLSLDPQEIGEVPNVGVWELSGGSSEPRVLHRTFAEYFVALFIRDRLVSGDGWGNVLADFLMQTILQVKGNENLLQVEGNVGQVLKFTYPIIIYFLNSLLTPDPDADADDIAIPSNVAKDIKNRTTTNTLELSRLVYVLASVDCDNILKIFDKIGVFHNPVIASSVFNNEFISCAIEYFGVALIRFGFLHFEQHHQEQFDPVMKSELLRSAVMRGEVAPVEFLIYEKGLSESLHEDATKTLLHHCLFETMDNTDAKIDQRIEILQMLNKINPALKENKNDHGKTPLLVYFAHERLRLELICLGADVTAQDKDQETFLHRVNEFSRDGYQVIVKKIKEMGKLGELVNLKSRGGITPLQSSVIFFDPLPDTLRMFAEAGADLNYTCSGYLTQLQSMDWHMTALTYAVRFNRSLSTLQTLIDLGADKGCRAESGNTLLHVAADNGAKSVPTLEFLVREHGMDVNVRNDRQETPLDIVLRMKHGTQILENLNHGWKFSFEMGLVIFELGGRPTTSLSTDSIKYCASSNAFQELRSNTGGRIGNELFDENGMGAGSVEGFDDDMELKLVFVDILLLHIYLFGKESVESGTCGKPSPHPLNYPYLKALLLKEIGREGRSYEAIGRLTDILRKTIERTIPIWDQETINKFNAEEI